VSLAVAGARATLIVVNGLVWRFVWYGFRSTYRRHACGDVALAILIGLLGGIAMLSVRRRRSDLALLKALGCTRCQLAALWNRFAAASPVVLGATVFGGSIFLAVIGAPVRADLAAAFPLGQAARLTSTTLLRTD
jgi:hypothetical protein